MSTLLAVSKIDASESNAWDAIEILQWQTFNMLSTGLCVNVRICFPSLSYEVGPVNYVQNLRKHGGSRISYWNFLETLDESNTLENITFCKACEFGH